MASVIYFTFDRWLVMAIEHGVYLKDKDKPKNGTKAGMEYMTRVKMLPCCTIGCGRTPCDAHHIRDIHVGKGQKSSDFETIPLCKECHQEGKDSVHKAKSTWERVNGTQRQHVKETQRKLGYTGKYAIV